MIIINSGAYVLREFQAEFGRIPPSLLPLGNHQLIEHQLDRLRTIRQPGEQVALSLPQSYTLSDGERQWLQARGVQVAAVPDGLSLAESVLFVLNTMCRFDEGVRLLHGDTLIDDLPSAPDIIGVAETTDDYAWEVERSETEKDLVWCGFFSFSSARELTVALATARGDFVAAVRAYGERRPLALHRIAHWYDLGHINTYFRSRARFSTERAFNQLYIAAGTVIKSGLPPQKIQAEADWFLSLPSTLKKYAPQLIAQGGSEHGECYYELEYLPLVPLNEVFVHGRNGPSFWIKIFGCVAAFISDAHAAAPASPNDVQSAQAIAEAQRLYADKTFSRLAQYAEQSACDLALPRKYEGLQLPSLQQIAQTCVDRALSMPVMNGAMHGDLCLSNILFDSRADSIKLVDPRGLTTDGLPTWLGDQKYDLAKLAHSVIGLYDFIIAGRYRLIEDVEHGVSLQFDLDERMRTIQHAFLAYPFVERLSMPQLLPVVILLFLSMLPLHSDRRDRQQAMLANALRLYALMENR